MAKQQKKLRLTGICIKCGKKEILSDDQIKEAQDCGCPFSSCCSFPLEIVRAKI